MLNLLNKKIHCRHCKSKNIVEFLDLNFSPLANSYLTKDDLNKEEYYYPLQLIVCKNCWLVQTKIFIDPKKIFKNDYAYFSSVSKSYLEHAKNYVKNISNFIKLDNSSRVVEIASNDGYLLKNFKENKIQCLGIEPTLSTANESRKIGIPTINKFFSNQLSRRIKKKYMADLIIANNVYAHIPDINDFTLGIKNLLKKKGIVTIEFQHLINIFKLKQFDTIYHEHYSYLNLFTVIKIFKKFGLKVWRVEKIETHGGSLRVFGCHEASNRKIEDNVKKILNEEKNFGLFKNKIYLNFQNDVNKIKNNLIKFLTTQSLKNKKVCAYGAAAKGNTLLNYAGVKSDLIEYIFDAAKSKINKYLPGSHIEILEPSKIFNIKPDYVLIMPWNIKKEVIKYLYPLKKNNTKFIIAIPRIQVV
jgi:hypothetical protein